MGAGAGYFPGTGSQGLSAEGSREETSLLAFVSVLLRHRRTLALTALIGATLLAVMSATEASRYVSRASFIARGVRSASQGPGMLHQLGLATGTGIDQSQTTTFYSELAKSRSILGPVSKQLYTVTTDSAVVKGTLASFHGLGSRRPEIGASLMLRELARTVSTSVSSRTGIVVVTVQSIRPELASQIAANILAGINGYSATRRRTDAVAERAFVEDLLAGALGRLRVAEEELGRFREVNRDYENSAQLRLQNDRLARTVSMQQEVYTRLAAAYEQARIEEARDLSPIMVVEPPETPVSPETGTAVRKTLLGMIAGLLVGIILAFLSERMRETRAARTPALAEFEKERAGAFASLRWPR